MESSTSKILDNAIEELSSLPGVGKKTALKFALDILKRSEKDVERFIDSVHKLKFELHSCKVCHNICEGDICDICSDKQRTREIVCVVENIKDIIAIERTGQFHGVYHVLGGIISPMEAIAPSDLNIATLLERIDKEHISEIIFALSATIEGDSTAYYINRKIGRRDNLKISTIAKGISIGNELDYTDDITLGKSIINRIAFN